MPEEIKPVYTFLEFIPSLPMVPITIGIGTPPCFDTSALVYPSEAKVSKGSVQASSTQAGRGRGGLF